MRDIKERDVVKALKTRVKQLGGTVRKVRWIGRRNAPDLLVMWIDKKRLRNAVWIEAKAPGENPTAAQHREHARMRSYGMRVAVVDSLESVDNLLGLS